MSAVNKIAEILYPIKAACLLSGLPADTLRAWERRYQVVTPRRRNNRRLYSQSDIQRLKLLKWAVDHGHRIGHVAGMSDAALAALQDQTEAQEASESPSAYPLDRIVDMMKHYDPQADMELARLASLLPPRDFIFEVVQPMMEQIGMQWENGDLTVAQEHFTSAGVRNVLGLLLRTYGSRTDGPPIVFATPPHEPHEFGILIAAMIAAIEGFRPVYLGPDLPLVDIAQTAAQIHACAVVISVNRVHADPASIVATLRESLPRATDLIVGGRQSHRVQVQSAPRISVAPTLEIFEDLIDDMKPDSGRSTRPGPPDTR